MSQEIEIEFKNLLTKDEFHQLLTHLPFPKQGHKQINYYFETKDFSLRKNTIALRIREVNHKYILTLKEPHSSGILETHDLLTKQEALSWLNGHNIEKEQISKQLQKYNILTNTLQCFGCLTTVRREVEYQNVLLVLDYSEYNNQSDYEFELEAPDKETGLEVFNHILTKYHINKKDTPNKIHRFFTTFKK